MWEKTVFISLGFHGYIRTLKYCFKSRIISTASLPSSIIFVGLTFTCFFRQTLRHRFIHWRNILFQNIWNKHRCRTFIKTWMCKARVLMQSSPFRLEESKLIYFSIHLQYTVNILLQSHACLRSFKRNYLILPKMLVFI